MKMLFNRAEDQTDTKW